MLSLVEVTGENHATKAYTQLEHTGEDDLRLGLPLRLIRTEVDVADRQHSVSTSFLESSSSIGTFYGRRRDPDAMLSEL